MVANNTLKVGAHDPWRPQTKKHLVPFFHGKPYKKNTHRRKKLFITTKKPIMWVNYHLIVATCGSSCPHIISPLYFHLYKTPSRRSLNFLPRQKYSGTFVDFKLPSFLDHNCWRQTCQSDPLVSKWCLLLIWNEFFLKFGILSFSTS